MLARQVIVRDREKMRDSGDVGKKKAGRNSGPPCQVSPTV